MHKHTNRGAALASALPTAAGALDPALESAARRVLRGALRGETRAWRRLVAGPARHVAYRLVREDARSCPVEALSRLLAAMARAGYPEAALRQVSGYIEAEVDRLTAGMARRPLATVDRAETEAEQTENRLAEERHLFGCSAPRLTAEIDALEREIAVSREKLVLLREALTRCQDGRPQVALPVH